MKPNLRLIPTDQGKLPRCIRGQSLSREERWLGVAAIALVAIAVVIGLLLTRR